MPRNSSGSYTLPAGNPVEAGTVIEATWANTTLSDLGNEVTNSLSRNGNGGMLAPFRLADGTLGAPGIAWTNEPSTGFYRSGAGEMWGVVSGQQVVQYTVNGLLVPSGKSLTINGTTGRLPLPTGTTAQREPTPPTGLIRFNTDLSVAEVYNGSDWSTMQNTSLSSQTFSGDSIQTAFTLSSTPVSLQSIEVFISGVRQYPTTNYTFSGTTLTFLVAPTTGTNNILVRWLSALSTNVPADGSVTTAKLATLTPGVVISGSSVGDALRITQTGTGNALVVEDSASPDSTPFVIDASGNVGIGTPTPLDFLHVENSASILRGTNVAATPASLTLGRRRTSGASVQGNDHLSAVISFGWDGANYIQAASIRGEVDGTPGAGSMPGRLVFSTTPSGSGTPTERMRIDSAGTVTLAAASGLTIGRTAVTAPAASDGNVFSGTYTPSLTNATNVTSSTAVECQYMRVGNVVTVSGQVTIQSTASGNVALGMSIPVASNFTQGRQASGFVQDAAAGGSITGAIIADTTNDRLEIRYVAAAGASTTFAVHFTYRVI
jgi:hypothetical protein